MNCSQLNPAGGVTDRTHEMNRKSLTLVAAVLVALCLGVVVMRWGGAAARSNDAKTVGPQGSARPSQAAPNPGEALSTRSPATPAAPEIAATTEEPAASGSQVKPESSSGTHSPRKERLRALTSSHERFEALLAKEEDLSANPEGQWDAALGLEALSVAAALDAQGRAIETEGKLENCNINATFPGEVRFVSDGYLYSFHKDEFPEYEQVRLGYLATIQATPENKTTAGSVPAEVVMRLQERFTAAVAVLSKD